VTIRIGNVVASVSFASLAGSGFSPTSGIPRTRDGKPDLSAPAPKTSAGKPYFSGMRVPRDVRPCDASQRGVLCAELPITPQLSNFALGLKDGLPYQP
jgi:hypothetical protein